MGGRRVAAQHQVGDRARKKAFPKTTSVGLGNAPSHGGAELCGEGCEAAEPGRQQLFDLGADAAG